MLEFTKICIDTRLKAEGSKSESGFTIELPTTVNVPDDTTGYINDIVLPVSWTTTDEINHKLYYSKLQFADG